MLTFLAPQVLASLCFHSLSHWSSITFTKQVLHQQLKTSLKPAQKYFKTSSKSA